MPQNTPTPKYRPVLTAAQITHILHLAKTENPISSQSVSVIGTLAPFQAKIENAGLTPAYTITSTSKEDKKRDLIFSLGIPTASTSYMSKEEVWERCYTKYKLTPTACSLEEIAAAKEHMYLNDMMTDEELKSFEQGTL